MCFNLYLGELLTDISEKKNCFFNKEQVIIQMAYSDFPAFLNCRLYYYEDYIATAKAQEDKPDAHT